MAAAAALGAYMQVGLQFALEKIEALVSHEISLYRGLKGDLKKLEKSFSMHQELLFQAEGSPICNRTIQSWFDNFEDAVTEARNVLERIEYEYLHLKIQPHDLMGYISRLNPQNFGSVVARRVKGMNAKLESLHQQGTRLFLKQNYGAVNSASNENNHGHEEKWETDSFPDDTKELIDRDDLDVDALVQKLCDPGNDDKHVSVISIVGMGGIGKTTLARSLFNHKDIESVFGENRCWVWLSENFGDIKILERMLQSRTRTNHQLQSREAIVWRLREEIKNQRFFLVLDNMWEGCPCISNWEDLTRTWKGIGAVKGNCIVITTQDAKLAATVSEPSEILFLKKLSDDLCWNILRKKARLTGAEEELEDIGKKMAEKCQGIPLAASIVGGMLRNERATEEWQSILDEGLQFLHEHPRSRLMEILKLSFYRLPSVWLQKCFAYCSVLETDTEIQRERLIQLWMGEGFLQDTNPQSRKTKEELGNDFFNKLLQRGLFQDAQKDEYGQILHCRMHDFVHKLACLVSASKMAKDLNISEQVRYLVLINKAQEGVLSSNKGRVKNIETLFWGSSLSAKTLKYVPFLRVLILSSLDLKELPEKVFSYVIHLTYLDISQTGIVKLPESICKLYFLETLIAKKLPETLLHFPDKFKNLQNLRFLDYFTRDSSAKMPAEMKHLTRLRKLPFFNIGKEKGRQIRELGPLKNLSGSLQIRNLELVFDKEESCSAKLNEKSKLVSLKLEWSSSQGPGNNAVLDGLKPHTNLKSLEIHKFLGSQLPCWISGIQKLERLEITGCENCQVMVSLRCLPHLRYLKLNRMNSLKEWVEDTAATTRSSIKQFCNLEELILMDCPQLSTAPSDFPSLKKLHVSSVKLEVITSFCSRVKTLTKLYIEQVEQLTGLPSSIAANNKSLVSLTISCCPQLTEIVREISGLSTCLEELEVFRCPELTQLPEDLYNLKFLKILKISMCSNLISFPSPQPNQRLPRLRFLCVCDCDRLTSFPVQIIQGSYSLQQLWISNCQEVTSFDVDFRRMPSLYWFSLSNCRKLTSIPRGLENLTCLKSLWIGPFSETMEFDSLKPIFDAIQQLSPTLDDLQLFGWPHWDLLPDQLQHLQRLVQLCIHNFGIQELPDWFGNFALLEKLHLFGCESLERLPSAQAMSRLTSLRELLHDRCSLLEHKLVHETGLNSERSKIPSAVEIKTLTSMFIRL